MWVPSGVDDVDGIMSAMDIEDLVFEICRGSWPAALDCKLFQIGSRQIDEGSGLCPA